MSYLYHDVYPNLGHEIVAGRPSEQDHCMSNRNVACSTP